MLAVCVVWIDREQAKLFHLSQEKMERRQLHARHPGHHAHPLDEIDRKRQEKQFFSQVGSEITGANKLLILGPGVAKHHFYNFLMEQMPALGKSVIGCETVDHPTDAQIAEMARKLFQFSTPAAAK